MFETEKSALGLCHHCCHGGSMADVWLASNLPLHPTPLLCMMQGIFMTKSQVSVFNISFVSTAGSNDRAVPEDFHRTVFQYNYKALQSHTQFAESAIL